MSVNQEIKSENADQVRVSVPSPGDSITVNGITIQFVSKENLLPGDISF